MVDTGADNYSVQINEKYGRFLVANKDLEGGELIFVDTPFVVGPKPDTPPLCLGCYCPVSKSVCSQCGWPCCSADCEKSQQHAGECEVFRTVNVTFQTPEDWTASSSQLDCITPLRMLLAKEKDNERWQTEIDVMETHTEERQQLPTWNVDQINISDFLIDYCKLGDRFNKELVQKVCGILEVNSIEIPSRNGLSIRAVYPRLAIASHSCVPNIVHTILQDNYQVQVRAAVPIYKDDQLHLCYTHVLYPTQYRRELLLESKFFSCDCPRCSDPTELGTHMSTLKCTQCDNGIVLPTDALDAECQWVCSDQNCNFKTSGGAVRRALAVVQKDIDQVDMMEAVPQAIERREALLKKYKSIFHPRHALLLCLKHALAQLYGKVEGYMLDDLPDILLERKAELCQSLLQTLDTINPGETRMRGMMLYELHAPLMLLARNEYNAGFLTTQQFKEKVEETLELLADATKILTREDPNSPEGIIGRIAKQSGEQLSETLNSLDI